MAFLALERRKRWGEYEGLFAADRDGLCGCATGGTVDATPVGVTNTGSDNIGGGATTTKTVGCQFNPVKAVAVEAGVSSPGSTVAGDPHRAVVGTNGLTQRIGS